jgi:phosphohistidine swiveling domain-containing protein
VVVGVANATVDLLPGEIITLTIHEGVVHRGALNPIEANGRGLP